MLDVFGNYSSYIYASYVKYVEMAGARVVPLLINQADEYYEKMFYGTNGMLIPGGDADIHNSGMVERTSEWKLLCTFSFCN